MLIHDDQHRVKKKLYYMMTMLMMMIVSNLLYTSILVYMDMCLNHMKIVDIFFIAAVLTSNNAHNNYN